MTPEAAQGWAQLVGTLGFAVVAAGYLIKWMTGNLNGKLDRLTSAVESQTAATDRLGDKTDRLAEKITEHFTR